MEHIAPKYSIGIIGIASMNGEGFGTPKRSAEVHAAEFFEKGIHAELRVATEEHGIARIKAVAVEDADEKFLVVLEEFSTLGLTLPSHSSKRYRRRIELVLEECARATVVLLPQGPGESEISLNAKIGKEAELTVVQVFSEGKGVKYEEAISLDGEDAGVHVLTLAAPAGETILDLSTHVRFGADHTRGSVRALGFLRGESKTIYRATGDILPSVVSPDSSEEARFLILEKGAEISAIPSLDIASDRVATSHKLAVHRLGEKELFYPKTRGMSESEVRAMLEEGYLERELSCLKNEDLVGEIKRMVSGSGIMNRI
jgi:Fe-S cluster assembly scaffold protein SufB